MKKILVFTDAFSGGGAEEVMSIFSNELVRNFDVIHVSKWLGPKEKVLKSNMINLKKTSSKLCLPDLYKISKKFRPDFIFTSTSHNNILILILKYLLPFNVKVVVRVSSVASVIKDYSWKNRLINFYLLKNLYKYAHKIIAQSADISSDLIDYYKIPKEKIKIINNPIYKGEIIQNELRDNTIWLLTIGRFSKEKGHERLIEVMTKLPNNYKLRIMGDGILKNKIETLVKDKKIYDKVEFLGFLDESEKLKIINKSNLYIQTSFVEGFPNSLLQAVSLGLPAIAFDVPGGTKEIINEGNGCLIEDGNLEAMAKKIQETPFEQFNAEKMQSDIIGRFGVQKVMSNLKTVFNDS